MSQVTKGFRTPNQIAASVAPNAGVLKATLATLAQVKAQTVTVEPVSKAPPVPTIGIAPMGKPTVDVKKANDKANYSLGEGAAESFINCVKAQGVSLKVYLQAIADGDQQWRKGFRVALDKHRDAMNEYVKANPDNPVYAAAAKSAKPRISEAIGFSKAIDAGFSPDMSQGYHAIIGASVAFRASKSAPADGTAEHVGPTVKKTRGRTAKPKLDKVKAFLLSLSLTAEELVQVRDMVDTLATLARAK